MGRGSIIDQDALIGALRDRTILSAGLDVYADEPRVPQAMPDIPYAVLTTHGGSSSEATFNAMAQLVVDNLYAWSGVRLPRPKAEAASRSTPHRVCRPAGSNAACGCC